MDNLFFNKLYSYINSLFPNARCELFYSKDYELVIAVMLSAQTTDKAVNNVTKTLFNKYKSINEINDAKISDIEEIIKPLGLYKNKAKNIKEIASKLVNEFEGIVPNDKLKLQTLSGIGNKSAGVIRAEVFKIPDLPVDTHILRISKRLGVVNDNATPNEVENKLKNLLPKEEWISAHHKLIFFGRYFCTAKKPHCDECKIREYCHYKNTSC